ncbi:MAG TPA: DUF481 domain-containing protein [Bryobacteraceae bacterium]|nr:DUF481 domain-containing protein [Bryobacteraceae bacterium]
MEPACKRYSHSICAGFALLLLATNARPQTPAPPPDSIIFSNGDKLTGRFLSATGSSLRFKSDALGDIIVDWSKVQELHTSGQVAVIRKGVKVAKHLAPSSIPQGRLTVENQAVQLGAAPPQPPQSIPLADTNVIVDQPTFEKATTRKSGVFEDWAGAVTLGATLVNATQDNRTFTGAISLMRAEPAETWLNPHNRTSLDFTAAYGDISQPHTSTIKTSIFHGDVERDEYLFDSIFAFGRGDFDHNYSQGLDLQQTYSGGIGWTAIDRANQTLDLKGGMSYVRQQFHAGPDQSLVGSILAEHYSRGFRRGLVLDQHLSFTPAWNNLSAYSALFSTQVTMPTFKRINASTGIIDTFLNNPPPGFRKNSFQFNLGFTYLLK